MWNLRLETGVQLSHQSSDFSKSEPFRVLLIEEPSYLSSLYNTAYLGLVLHVALLAKLLSDGQQMIYFMNSSCGSPTFNSQW